MISTERPCTGQVGAAHWSDQFEPGNPNSKKPTSRAPKLSKPETAETQDNREHTKMFTRNKTRKGSAPIRPVRPGQLGMNSNPRVNSPKSNSRSPELLHELAQDFGDSRNTSWALHSQDLVHQNLLEQEESKKSHQECI
jgi:hypothetical protein